MQDGMRAYGIVQLNIFLPWFNIKLSVQVPELLAESGG